LSVGQTTKTSALGLLVARVQRELSPGKHVEHAEDAGRSASQDSAKAAEIDLGVVFRIRLIATACPTPIESEWDGPTRQGAGLTLVKVGIGSTADSKLPTWFSPSSTSAGFGAVPTTFGAQCKESAL
jgi:hypothetical protein